MLYRTPAVQSVQVQGSASYAQRNKCLDRKRKTGLTGIPERLTYHESKHD